MRMEKGLIYPIGATEAVRRAAQILPLPLIDHPAPEVTHLLLDIPSFRPDGKLRSGEDLGDILPRLPENITIIGGNLNHPLTKSYRQIDLLQDPQYLAENAYITAECTLDITLPRFGGLIRGCPVLILGWGRIGKCLARLLQDMGAEVTVAARKETDRAALVSLGFEAVDMSLTGVESSKFLIVFNTVPAPVLDSRQVRAFRADCLKIDLASTCGIEGADVVTARGLPGIYRPQASGALISRTLLRLLNEEDRV